MATKTDSSQGSESGTQAKVVRSAVAAAATGAAAYTVLKLRSNRDAADERDSVEEAAAPEGDEETHDASGKRQELTQALAAKVAGAKKAGSRLKPGGAHHDSILESAWEAASEQLLPVAQDAAEALGETVAKKVPDLVRDGLMPRFIEGFQKAR